MLQKQRPQANGQAIACALLDSDVALRILEHGAETVQSRGPSGAVAAPT